MPGWDKISRVDLEQGVHHATPGFAWAGHGNRMAVLHEDPGNNDLRIHEIDPATGTILTKDVVPKCNFPGTPPLCCEWTPDGRHIAMVRASTPCVMQFHDPNVLSQVDFVITLEDSITVTGVVFRGHLIYGIDRDGGTDGWFKAWDWDGNRVMAAAGQLMMNGKFAGNAQRVEDLSDHGYLMAFTDTQDSLMRFFDPMQIFIDHQAAVPRSGQVASCIGGALGDGLPFIWLATCSDVGGPRAKTGVVSILNADDEYVETCSLWCDYRDLAATLRYQETLAGKAVGTQLDHNSQKPTTGENGPPDYTAHPDPDAVLFHFQVETDGIGFKTALGQDRFLLSKAWPNAAHWRLTWWQKTGGAICGMEGWYKDSNDWLIAYRVGNDYYVQMYDNGVFVTLHGPIAIDAGQFPSASWEHCELVRNGNMYSLYVNGVGIAYGRHTGTNTNLSEYVSAGPFHRSTTAARTKSPSMYVPVGAEL